MLKTLLPLALTVLSANAQNKKPYLYGQCVIRPNPANPKANFAGGHILLAQENGKTDLWIRVGASKFDLPNSSYGLSINENRWDGKDCATAGKHYNAGGTSVVHGNWAAAVDKKHLGDLPMLVSDWNNVG